MADSIPSLRRQLGEARQRIAELERKLAEPVAAPTYVSDPAKDDLIVRLQARIRDIEWQSSSQSGSQ